MTLSSPRIEPLSGGFRVSVQIESERGPNGELWFEVEDESRAPRPEMAVATMMAACLPVAGWIGEDLVSLDTCETRCLGAARVYARGFARLHGRPAVAVEAPSAPVELPQGRGGVASFSGGVDSFYTLLKHQETLDALVTGLGFDTRYDDDARNAKLRSLTRDAAQAAGLRCIFVRTNFRALFDPHASWTKATHGGMLIAFALLLSEAVETYLIPSSSCIDQLIPEGNHALLIQAWAHTPTQVVMDGWDTYRNDKLREIGDHALVRRFLRVCARPAEGQNCGRCFKCVKTMLLMAVHNVPLSETFPGPLTARQIRRLHITTWRDVRRFGAIRQEAKANPDSAWLAAPLEVARWAARGRLVRRAVGSRLRIPPLKRLFARSHRP